MPDVRVLVAASDALHGDKGDVIDVVPIGVNRDWGSQTVAPDWIRLTITGVPGSSQEAAEATIKNYLANWKGEFIYQEVNGATGGLQRYRVEASPEISNDFDLSTKLQIRDDILARFNGVLVNQSQTHFEFDGEPYIPLDEIGQVIAGLAYRRFRFPDSMINAAMGGSIPGQPVFYSRTRQWVANNIEDKLAS